MKNYYQKTKCKFCKKAFDVYIHNVRKGFGKYCSKACSNKGNKLGFKNKHKYFGTVESRKIAGIKISLAKKGIKFSDEHKKSLSIAQIKKWDRIGRKECRKNHRQRKCNKCVKWRKNVFERDNYTCVLCGIRGVSLEADHIKAWIRYPKLRHKLLNGRTLCRPCHMKTPNYKSKARTYKHLSDEEYQKALKELNR